MEDFSEEITWLNPGMLHVDISLSLILQSGNIIFLQHSHILLANAVIKHQVKEQGI